MASSMNVPVGLISDNIICLLAEDIERSCGLAIDVGSTIGKFIYRSNKEYKNGQPITPQADATKGTAHFAMFPRTDIPGMLKYIKEHTDFTRNEAGDLIVNSSGIGGATYRKDLEGNLNCKLNIISEFDCFCKSFLAMEKIFTAEELFIPDVPEVAIEIEKTKKHFEQQVQNMYDVTDIKEAVEHKASTSIKDSDRPRLLVMAGSGSAIMQINSDNSFNIMEGIYTSGRFMYGLASILTGENDFDKLIKLAEKGNGKTVDLWSTDLTVGMSTEGESVYEMEQSAEGVQMFPFGKGISTRKCDMKKEDLAWSSLMATAVIHCQMINATVKACKAKHVYFVGNVFNTEWMRSAFSKKKFIMCLFNSKDIQYEFHFLRNGGMYGALGAFLNK